jgi:hypothetical protein
MSKEKLRSSYELAMERLRAQDRESGVEEPRPLTDEQKQAIARLRQDHKAKLAELEILQGDKVAAAGVDPQKLEEVETHLRIDRERLESSLESAIRAVKSS